MYICLLAIGVFSNSLVVFKEPSSWWTGHLPHGDLFFVFFLFLKLPLLKYMVNSIDQLMSCSSEMVLLVLG